MHWYHRNVSFIRIFAYFVFLVIKLKKNMIMYRYTTNISKVYSYLTYFYDPLPKINDFMSTFGFKFRFRYKLITPTPFKNKNVSSAFHVNKSSVKMNIMPVIPYKL